MKNLIVIAAICCLMPKVQAQKIVEKSMNFNNKNTVSLDLQITDSINVNTWNKNEVYVYATIEVNGNKDNEAYQTTFKEEGDRIEVKAKFMEDYFKGQKNQNFKTEITWKVMVPENADLSIKTINGNIIIAGKVNSVKANSISGFIDLGIPANKKADLELKTITGTIYTDIVEPKTGNKMMAEVQITDKMNGGGLPVKLETISGDIFLRKTK